MTEQMQSFRIRHSVARCTTLARKALVIEPHDGLAAVIPCVTVTLLDTLDAGPIK
jgi:hypothetical protein